MHDTNEFLCLQDSETFDNIETRHRKNLRVFLNHSFWNDSFAVNNNKWWSQQLKFLIHEYVGITQILIFKSAEKVISKCFPGAT